MIPDVQLPALRFFFDSPELLSARTRPCGRAVLTSVAQPVALLRLCPQSSLTSAHLATVTPFDSAVSEAPVSGSPAGGSASSGTGLSGADVIKSPLGGTEVIDVRASRSAEPTDDAVGRTR